MAARPNFTDVQLKGDKIEVLGESSDDDLADLVGIQVFLSQPDEDEEADAHIASGFVADVTSSWSALLDKGDLVTGPAIAIGVETHSTPFSAITWAQPVKIE